MKRLFLSLFILCLLELLFDRPAAGGSNNAFRTERLQGEVVPYAESLKQMFGISLQDNWAKDLLALRTKQGELLPILPTENGRFFYMDKAMRHRPVVLNVRRYNKTPGLQIIHVHTIKDGKLYEAYYWCGICAIKSFARQPCECCQEPVEFREDLTDLKLPE